MEDTSSSTALVFCPDCGSVLPLLGSSKHIKCYTCGRLFQPEALENATVEYVIHFNSRDKLKQSSEAKDLDGPVVDRICSKCGHDQMTYSTLQLRSADEGQTVFYKCVKCKNKEVENS